MPKPLASMDRPSWRVRSPLPSPSMMISSLPMPWLSAQAPMTKASLTEMQAMVSTPLAVISPRRSLKPGRWRAEQVGVKAPGTANRATVLPAKISSVVTGRGPSSVARVRLAEGMRSPIWTVMGAGSGWG